MTRPELKPLTSVRGLFAWAVVLYHVRLACLGWMPLPVVHVLARGYLAVDFFFLLSGFVIWLNYGGRLRAGGGLRDFWVRRLARIWPLHATMLAFAVLLAVALLASGRPAPHFPFALLPLHLAMMQNWGFGDPLMWNDPAWSISAEWAAYLLIPLAALTLPARHVPTPLLALCAALPLLLLAAVAMLWREPTLGNDIGSFGLLRCLTEFGCGTMLSALWRRWRGNCAAEAVAWAASAICFAGWAAGLPEMLAVPFAFACALLGLALGAERPRHPLSGRAIHWLGEVSYATYLSHFLLFFAFKLAFVRDPLDVPPAHMALFLLLVLGASALLYHGIERPAQRAILRAWANRRDPLRLTPARSSGSAPR